jgi:hypothetical protein
MIQDVNTGAIHVEASALFIVPQKTPELPRDLLTQL